MDLTVRLCAFIFKEEEEPYDPEVDETKVEKPGNMRLFNA